MPLVEMFHSKRHAVYFSEITPPHFSLSPSHLDTRSDEEMEKKVELLASVATALAR